MKSLRFLLIVMAISLLAAGPAQGQRLAHLKTTQNWEFALMCNGSYDLMSGCFDIHEMIKFREGPITEVLWSKLIRISGEAASLITEEVYRVNYFDMMGQWQGSKANRTVFINLVGDQGTHWILQIMLDYDWSGGELKISMKKIMERCL
ncbi:MAG: hypothetical protein R6V75_07710 [Bacteroidales bacterium]